MTHAAWGSNRKTDSRALLPSVIPFFSRHHRPTSFLYKCMGLSPPAVCSLRRSQHIWLKLQLRVYNLRRIIMVNFTILAGDFAPFIVSYLFNPDTNSLTILNQSPTGDNASWISLHPTNKNIL